MTRQHDQRNARPPDYCGRILNGNYSEELKARVVECCKRYHAFEETDTPAIPYIAAWRQESDTIWYEYASKRLADLLDCRLTDVAEVLRNCVMDRRIYRYMNAEAGISKEINSRDELSVAWREWREERQRTGAIEAVYKIALRKGSVIWLKDQATIETLEADRICLSPGLLTNVSKEMEAEDELEKHRDQLEAIVQARTAELTRLNEQLKLEVVERRLAEKSLKRSYNKLQQNLDETVNVISLTVEERDPYTAGHQRRMTDLAMQIATQIGLSAHAVKGIQMAGLIHDIGKISIPAEILSKPGRLNEIEIQLIRRHPQVAHDILKKIDFPWPVDLMVLQHHERIDGSGYPQGLTGGETLVEARILCVADVVEAIASHRPYRPALGIDKALEDISKNSGRLYDPLVVAACLRLFRERSYQLK
jgi:HD-GYP domain-containing protein (c-di-GMP phosphodiesterase class II)